MKKLIIDGKEIDISFVDNIILEIKGKTPCIDIESGKVYLDYRNKRYELKDVEIDACDKVSKDVVINEKVKEVVYKGENLNLTYMEYKIFKFIVESNKICSRKEICRYIYNSDYMYDEGRNVDVIITKIRKKAKNFDIIKNKRGFGYFFPF